MYDIAFEKAKGRGGTVNRSAEAEAVVWREGSLKKRCFEKFGKIHKKTSVPESLFW